MNELGIEFDKKHFKKMIEKYDIGQKQNIIELQEGDSDQLEDK
jgi:hypothetical protein